jgi:DNA polymerase III alpha subunit
MSSPAYVKNVPFTMRVINFIPMRKGHLKSEREMFRLFRSYPDAIKRTQEIAEACTFSLDQLKYEYPQEFLPKGKTPLEHLTDLTWKGAKEIFGEHIPEKIVNNINHELASSKREVMRITLLTFLQFMTMFRTLEGKISFARDVVLPPIQQSVFVWGSPL